MSMRAAGANVGRRDFLRLAGQASVAALAILAGVRRAHALAAEVAKATSMDAKAALGASAAAATRNSAAAFAPPAAHPASAPVRPASSVVDVTGSARVIDGLQVDAGRVQEMLECSLTALAEVSTAREA